MNFQYLMIELHFPVALLVLIFQSRNSLFLMLVYVGAISVFFPDLKLDNVCSLSFHFAFGFASIEFTFASSSL